MAFKSHIVLFIIILTLLKNVIGEASTDDVVKLMEAFDESHFQNLSDLSIISEPAFALSEWKTLAEIVGQTVGNFVKIKYTAEMEEFKAIKLLGNLSLAIFNPMHRKPKWKSANTERMQIRSNYDMIVSFHLSALENLMEWITDESITPNYYSLTCKHKHNPITIITKLHNIMVKNCNKDDLIQIETNESSPSFKMATEFFNELESTKISINTSFYQNYRKRIILVLSHFNVIAAGGILESSKRNVLNKTYSEIWDVLGITADALFVNTIGSCLPHELAQASNFKFNLVADAFARITKDLRIATIAAVYCIDELADGNSSLRSSMLDTVITDLKEIFVSSKMHLKKLFQEFFDYNILTALVREFLSSKFGSSKIPIENYNQTAKDIQSFLEDRGYNDSFFQVAIVQNKVYGKEMEMFSSSSSDPKLSYMIADFGEAYIFLNRYNNTNGSAILRARKAFQYISSNIANITDAIEANYAEAYVGNLYKKVEEIVPNLISDEVYTGLLILSEWTFISNPMSHGLAMNTVSGADYFVKIYHEHKHWGITYYHKLIFFL